jgi:hypothetical protein
MANFSIAQSGKNINISSDGITINVTQVGSVANISADGYAWEVSAAGDLADIKLVKKGGFLRNSFSYYNVGLSESYAGVVGSLEYTTPRDASGIVGTITNIHTNDGSASYYNYFPGSIVRNGDYIYFINRIEHDPDVGPWDSQIVEYCISTGIKNYITFFTETDGYYASTNGYFNYISIIEGRKLLVFDSNCQDHPDTYHYHVYIVDFDTNTCTEQLDIPQYDEISPPHAYQRAPDSSCVIKTNDGDIHLLVSCYYGDYSQVNHNGWRIYHKNYTDNTAWTNTDINIDFGPDNHSIWSIYPYIISNNRYLCLPTTSTVTVSPDRSTYCIFVYDILSDTLDYTHGVSGVSGYPWGVLQAMEDATNHKIYLVETYDGWVSWNIYEFDPVTIAHNDTPIASGELFQSASNTHLYDWASSGDVLRTPDRLYQNNRARPAAIELQSNIMDDSDDSIWFMDGAILKRYNFNTGVVDKSIATGITAEDFGIIHLGDCLVITAQTDVDGYIMDYYLVT